MNWLKNLFKKISVYNSLSKEELETEIAYFYEKMISANSFKEEMGYKEILEDLDKQYRKLK